MNNYSYVALFEMNDNKSYTVTFPDLPGCITEGDDFHQAQLNAKEALELHLYNLEDEDELLPNPTTPDSIFVEPDTLVSIISANMALTRFELDNKRVSKNCTLPKWLIKAAEKEQVNFSKLLELAIRNELHIHE